MRYLSVSSLIVFVADGFDIFILTNIKFLDNILPNFLIFFSDSIVHLQKTQVNQR